MGSQKDKQPINFKLFENEIKQFKDEWIYKYLSESEFENGEFEEWCRLVDSSSDDYAWYLHSNGKLNVDLQPPTLFKTITNE